MKQQTYTRMFTKTMVFSIVLAAAWLIFDKGTVRGSQADTPPTDNELVGIWDMTVTGGGVYKYKYSISPGAWVAVGDTERGFITFTTALRWELMRKTRTAPIVIER